MAEREQRTGHHLTSQVASATAADTKRGQHFGLIAVLAALGVTAYLGYLGHAGAAGAVGTTTVVGVATAFVLGRKEPGAKTSESE